MKLSELLKITKIEVKNEIYDFEVSGLAPLESATSAQVSYVDQDKYIGQISASKAGGIFVRSGVYANLDASAKARAIVVDNPHLAFALFSQQFQESEFSADFAQSCADSSAVRFPHAKIYPNVFVGKGVTIGKNSTLYPGVVVGDSVKIGQNCKIYPNVVLYAGSIIGDNVAIHANSVIGSDGFGYAHRQDGRHEKIIHSGIVVVEDGVEIGANVAIDRAVFGETRICAGAKIDNLVQIGHNCVVGPHSLLVSQVGLAGSTTTGRNVVMGGQAGTGGHIHIGDFVQIAGRGAVGKNLPPNTKWGGHPLMELTDWMNFFAKLRRIVKGK